MPALRGTAVIAAAYFVGGVLLYLVGVSRLTDQAGVFGGGDRIDVRIAVLAVACAAVTVRRRHPIAAMAVGTAVVAVDAMLGPSLPVWLVYGDLLYAAVLYGPVRTRTVLNWSGSAAVTAAAVLAGAATRQVAAAVVIAGVGVLLVLTPVWWAGSLRDHRDLARAERSRADALALLAQRDRDAAVVAERRRLARDLHDVVAGHLAAIAIQSAAAGRLRVSDPVAAAETATAIRADAVAALTQMQAMIDLLRGTSDEVSLPGRLTDLTVLLASARAAGTEVTVTGAAPTAALDAAVTTSMTGYRIVAEMLTNAVRHAPGAPMRLTIDETDGELTITATNPLPAPPRPSGRAAEPGPGLHRSGTGLANIEARARAIGGTAGRTREGGRWTVWACLPITREPR